MSHNKYSYCITELENFRAFKIYIVETKETISLYPLNSDYIRNGKIQDMVISYCNWLNSNSL